MCLAGDSYASLRRNFGFAKVANPAGSTPCSLTLAENKIKTQRSFFYFLVIPAGVEPAIFWMRTRRPRPLDDGTIFK